MTNLTKVINKLAKNASLSETIADAKEEFEAKPYASEYRDMYKYASMSRGVLGLVSVTSGAIVADSINAPLWVTLPPILATLIIIELFKNKLTYSVFKTYYLSGRASPVAIVALLLVSASVFMSVKGAKHTGDKNTDGAVNEISSLHKLQIDSVNSLFILQKAEAENKAKAYFDQVSWQGKISHKNAKVYNALLADISKVGDANTEAINELKKYQVKQLENTQTKGADNSILIIALSVVNEVSILALLAFMIYYRYRAQYEAQLLDSMQVYTVNDSVLHKVSELARLSNASVLGLQATATPIKSNAIGFKATLKDTLKDSSVNTGNSLESSLEAALKSRQTKDTDYQQKYPDLIADLHELNRGNLEATTAQLATRHGVSEGTIYRVKKAVFI